MILAARGVLAVGAAATMGVAVLAALGAGPRMWALNAVAAVVGAFLVVGISRVGPVLARYPHRVLAAAALLLLATALWGIEMEGVRRWGPLGLHVGFLVLPLALAGLSRAGGLAAVAGVLALGVALALQPDAGSATAFALGMMGLAAWTRRPGHILAAVLAVAEAGLVWTRPDPLDPVAFVEGVVTLAAGQGPLLGAAACLALIAPGVVVGLTAWRRPALARVAGPAALFWLGAAGVSLVAPFPTPILGGGAGPILGYALTWGLLAGFYMERGEG